MMKDLDSHDRPGNKLKTDYPFFSIIITTYNRAGLLPRAIDSLISQTERDWEAIIVDDESTDDTCLRILPYISLNRQIRYFKKNHSGEALSKNAGINAAKGKFISFLDSDDEYHPLHLQSRKEILKTDTDVNLLYGGVKIIGNQYVPDMNNCNELINLNECVIGGTFFIEKDLLLRLKGFREIILGTDADLFERAVAAGAVVKKTKISTYIYHHENEDSITNMLIKNSSRLESSYTESNHK
jgi:glycosyltransferase involved in cell wall biosynthesis